MLNKSILKEFGFRFGDKGTHTSRTIMFQDLHTLLSTCPAEADRKEYASAIINDNCLGKRTLSTRRLTNQRLGELYALDINVPVFRFFRNYWSKDENGRELLAMLSALTRDPLLKETAPPILQMNTGEELARQKMIDTLSGNVGHRLNDNILDKVVRNTSSSWTQSGHLNGRNRKIRQRVKPTPAVVSFALLLGYISGERSHKLFDTIWTRILDSSKDELIYLATDAKRLGLLNIRHAGGIIDISFDETLTENEKRMIYVTN